jgi:MFS family permease
MNSTVDDGTLLEAALQRPSGPARPSQKSLRVWLTVVTAAAVVVCLLGIPVTLVAAGSVFFAADDPRTTMQDIWRLQAWVWGAAALFFGLLLGGVVGGWLAYRRGNRRLSLGLSLVGAAPVVACLGGIALLFLLNASALAFGGLFNH